MNRELARIEESLAEGGFACLFLAGLAACLAASVVLLLVILFKPHWLPGWFPKF